MPHWNLYQEFPVKGVERTLQIIELVVSDKFAVREARESLSTRGVYKNIILHDSLMILCQRLDEHYYIRVLYKNGNQEAARDFTQKIFSKAATEGDDRNEAKQPLVCQWT
jgi:hypothetical protein